MSNVDSQVIRNIQAEDRAYGEKGGKKSSVQTDKSQKYTPNFKRMSIDDIRKAVKEEELEYDDGYETS